MSTVVDDPLVDPDMPQAAPIQSSPRSFAFRSAKQAQVFDVIYSHFTQNRVVPSYRLLCKLLGWASLNSCFYAVRRLERDGFLVRVQPRNGTGGRSLLVPVGVKVKRVKSVSVANR